MPEVKTTCNILGQDFYSPNNPDSQDNRLKSGFTLAEALVMLFISSLIIVATMPVITRKKASSINKTMGPPGGIVCLQKNMPCYFTPPAKATNFSFYFDNSLVPAFSVNHMGKIKIVYRADGNCSKSMDFETFNNNYKQDKYQNIYLQGSYCTNASLVRIVY